MLLFYCLLHRSCTTDKMKTIPWRIVAGYGLIVLEIVCLIASIVCVQLLDRKIPDFELGVARYLGAVSSAVIPVFIMGSVCTNNEEV